MAKRSINVVDFSTVITKEDYLNLSDEQVKVASKEGMFHANYLRRAYSIEFLNEFLASMAREIAYIGSKYKNLDETSKELLAANICFPDDGKFIKCLLGKNITYDLLYNYSKAISKMKKLAALAGELNISEDIQLVSKKINILCSVVRSYFGIKDYNLIIAKINDIVVFKKDLYLSLENEIKRTR